MNMGKCEGHGEMRRENMGTELLRQYENCRRSINKGKKKLSKGYYLHICQTNITIGDSDLKENGIGLENHGFGLENDTENGLRGE